MKATCVVPTFQRHGNLPRIIDALLDTPEIAQVVIWNNLAQKNQELLRMIIEKYRAEPISLMADSEDRNVFTFGRYKGAMAATCGVVCTQDDDVLVSKDKWARLFGHFEKHEQKRLCCYLDEGHEKHGACNRHYIHTYKHGASTLRAFETLVGWGAVFMRDWVSDVFGEYMAVQEPDELSYRKADRIFTVMLGTEHINLRDDYIEHLPGSNDKAALYREPNHWELNKQAVERALYVLATRP